jgi:hypothetical protein
MLFKKYFDELLSRTSTAQTDSVFSYNNDMMFMNKNAHKNNYYGLDKFKLVIRKNDKDKQNSPYGWKYSDGEIINIHVDVISSHFLGQEEIFKNTLKIIKNKFNQQFSKNNSLHKVYVKVVPIGLSGGVNVGEFMSNL